MKSLFKVTLLATTMAVALNAPLSFAIRHCAQLQDESYKLRSGKIIVAISLNPDVLTIRKR
jgi:hypothetical protein